jgi:uncharacterized protein YegP (UPF0339 family)
MRPDKVQIYQAKRGLLRRKQYRARVIAPNGKVLLVTAEGYNNLNDLLAVTDRLFPHLMREGDPRDEGDHL